MHVGNLCQYLDWDSDYFGLRIAQITVNRLNPYGMKSIIGWCSSNNIDCIYFLGDVDDESTIRLLEDNNFHFVDIRITLERSIVSTIGLDIANPKHMIRPSTSEDVPALREIARVNHFGTRFYFDPNFSTSLCDALYETWIEKSCNDYADAVLVAKIQGQPVGYISCHLLDLDRGKIGLLGVKKDWRGIGLGQELVNESLRWFVLHGVTQVDVVTQGRNFSAQRLYQRCGFITGDLQLWYHRWFSSQ